MRSSYKKRSPSGNVNDVFVYAVSGSESEIAEYKKDQGENLREDDKGQPLFFATRFAGKSAGIVKTSAGRYIADMSEINAQANLAAQYGGNLGQAIANAAAAKLFSGGVPASVPVEAPADLAKS